MSSKTAAKYGKQVIRHNRELQFVRIGLMKVSPMCQRELRQDWVSELHAKMDIDKLGNPEVSHRDGYFYIMDGQHRIEAVKLFLGAGWEEQHLQCWVAEGLTEDQEAEIFLSLNDRKAVDVFQKFKVSVRAGRSVESDIASIVAAINLKISKQATGGAIRCVGTLKKVYQRNGPESLRRALCMARDAFGDAGLDAVVIDGLGLLCHRYNGSLDERTAVDSLNRVHGGVKGLLQNAELLRQKTGNAKNHCFAAASVQIINRNLKLHKKLASWWKN